MDWVRQWLRDYCFSPLHLPFFLSHFFFQREKQNTFVFSGSAVKILSWALAQCLLACSQGKSHETSVAKCSLIHMITIRLQDSATPIADLLLWGTFLASIFPSFGYRCFQYTQSKKLMWLSQSHHMSVVFFRQKREKRCISHSNENYNIIMKYNLLAQMPW